MVKVESSRLPSRMNTSNVIARGRVTYTARRIGKKEPGFDTSFRLGDNTQREIISTAEAFLVLLADPANFAKFTAYSMPANFVADLQADVDAIEDEKGEQTDDCTGRRRRL